MYQYDAIDQRMVDERVAQFRDQTRRFLDGTLADEEFLPLRLQNGLYIQKHAPMLRVAIPYGLLGTRQLRMLAHVARTYDRGYGHFSTRTNMQFNWPALERVPDALADLATVQMHSIQTSGNCIRNITTDHFAGIAPDEIVEPFVWAELLRQWSTFHPEFAFLPRKFKIGISGAESDRVAVLVHDIGLYARRDERGEIGFTVTVGGGLGRTPIVGKVLRDFIHWRQLINYLEAAIRVYNRFGRRDNKFKARIKILVKELGIAEYTRQVEEEWRRIVEDEGAPEISDAHVERIATRFTRLEHRVLPAGDGFVDMMLSTSPAFARWAQRNVHPHRVPGYRAVTLSLKRPGIPPGDVSADEMDRIAGLADEYSFGELRVTHEQNLVFADVEYGRLHELWQILSKARLATPNIGLLTNIIACPGGDFCALANAVSIPVADAITRRFDDLDYVFDIGELDLNISGCINACGHHHVGHIGVLGVDKNGEEWYQITIGGNQGREARIGRIIGRSVARDEVPDVVERMIRSYLELRVAPNERFVDVVARVGIEPFKEAAYATVD